MKRAWLRVAQRDCSGSSAACISSLLARARLSRNFSGSAQTRLAAAQLSAAASCFFAGARVEVVRSPGFDPHRTCFFMSNHVNLFDPFMLYCAIPQFVRGWELESHFKIPAYGWLMKRFGNVPVPDVRRPSDLKRMWRLTQDAIDGGTSLIIFPEAKRTRDGHVDEFQDGGFRVAQQLGIPIVPVSLVGSFQHHRTGHWMLWPAKVTVHLHDTIETRGMNKEECPRSASASADDHRAHRGVAKNPVK